MARTGSEIFFIFILTIVMIIGLYAGITYLKKTYYDPIYSSNNASEVVEKLQRENIIRDGDIIFQSKRNNQNNLINYLNKNDVDHCGIIILYRGKYSVLEVDDVVRFTPLEEWIPKGKGGDFTIKRMKDARINSNRLLNEGLKYSGKKDDIFVTWTDEMLYNAELVWKVIQHATGSNLTQLENFANYNFDSKGQELLKVTYGDNIPSRMQYTTVNKIYNSDKLEKIYSN